MSCRRSKLAARALLWVALMSGPFSVTGCVVGGDDDDDSEADQSASAWGSSSRGSSSTRRRPAGDGDQDEDAGVDSDDDALSRGGRRSAGARDGGSRAREGTERGGEDGDGDGDDDELELTEDYGALRTAAERAGRWLGSAVDAELLRSDRTYAHVLSKEFNSITASDALAWSVLEPERGLHSFEAADALLQTARAAGQTVRGRALLGHQQLPSWAQNLPPAELREAIERHVIETVGHFRGQVHAWDVIDDAIDPDTLQLRAGVYASLGVSGLAEVFRWVNQVDPDALLFYSDSGIEGPGPKADAVYALLEELAKQGATLDGVGFAAHLDTSGYPGESALRGNLERFAKLAPIVSYAALDVTTKAADPTGDPTRRRSAQRLPYQLVASVCASAPACRGLTTWGFTDRSTWSPDDEPLILDASYAKKPAYLGLLSGLSGRMPVLDETELLSNPSFGEGEQGWFAFGGGRLTVQSGLARSGSALTASERTQSYEGPGQTLTGKLAMHDTLCVSAWVRVDAASATVSASIKHSTGNEATDRYQQLASTTAGSSEWIELSGCGAVYVDPSETETTLFFAGAAPGVTIHLDDVSLRRLLAR